MNDIDAVVFIFIMAFLLLYLMNSSVKTKIFVGGHDSSINILDCYDLDAAETKPITLALFAKYKNAHIDFYPKFDPNKLYDAIYITGKHSHQRKLHSVRAKIKSFMITNEMTEKVNLVHNILAKVNNPPYLMRTFVINGENKSAVRDEIFGDKFIAEDEKSDKKYNKGNVWIWKPIGSFSGIGVKIIQKADEYEEAIKAKSNDSRVRGVSDYGFGILSRYIINPVLYNGIKFHLRMFYLVFSFSNLKTKTIQCAVYKNGSIITSGEKYKPDEFERKSIHDSHVGQMKGDYLPCFIEDFERGTGMKREGIFDQFCSIMTDISRIFRDKLDIYPENKGAFHIFGCDFMINADDNRLILLEINGKPGFKYKNYGEGKQGRVELLIDLNSYATEQFVMPFLKTGQFKLSDTDKFKVLEI